MVCDKGSLAPLQTINKLAGKTLKAGVLQLLKNNTLLLVFFTLCNEANDPKPIFANKINVKEKI